MASSRKSVWEPRALLIAVSALAGLIVVGMVLGLGLGIGLRNGSGNLTLITTTIRTTTVSVNTSLVNSTYASTLTSSSPTWSPPHQPTPDHYYESIQILVTTAGNYTFLSLSVIDLYGYFYSVAFDATNPLQNFVTRDDNTGANLQFRFLVTLQPGVSYFLVVTTNNGNVTGPFAIVASGPATVSFTRVTPTITTTTTTTTITVSTTTTALTTTQSLATAAFSSALTTNNPTFTRLGGTSNSYFYESIALLPSVTGTYTIASQSNIFLYGYLYNDTFDANNPGTNLIFSINDTSANPDFAFSVNLDFDIIYTLVITIVNMGIIGSFTITASGPQQLIFQSLIVTTITTTASTTTETATVLTTTFASNLSTINPLYARPGTLTSDYYYEPIQLFIGVNGNYTVQSASNVFLFGSLYISGTFDVTNPNDSLIIADFDTSAVPNFVFSFNFQSDTSYVLVITTVNTRITGLYTITISGPSFVIFQSLLVTGTTTTTTTLPGSVCLTPFQSATNYSVGTGPKFMTAADLNNDAVTDLAVVTRDDNFINVLIGNSNGTFPTQTFTLTGLSPVSVASANVNGDLINDLIVVSFGLDTVDVFIGNGNGTFVTPQQTFGTGLSPRDVRIDIFNLDINADLVVANSGSNTVSVLFGNGDGTFQDQVPYQTGRNPSAVVTGDFNNDLNSDIAVVNSNDSTVGILLNNNGNGTFLPQITYPTGTNPVSLAVDDFNQDGVPDLATANLNSGTVTVLLNNGSGNFSNRVDIPVGILPSFVISGDFNGDLNNDLIVADLGANSFCILLGFGNGTFRNPTTVNAGDVQINLVAIPRNGRLDLAVALANSSFISVFLNQCP